MAGASFVFVNRRPLRWLGLMRPWGLTRSLEPKSIRDLLQLRHLLMWLRVCSGSAVYGNQNRKADHQNRLLHRPATFEAKPFEAKHDRANVAFRLGLVQSSPFATGLWLGVSLQLSFFCEIEAWNFRSRLRFKFNRFSRCCLRKVLRNIVSEFCELFADRCCPSIYRKWERC